MTPKVPTTQGQRREEAAAGRQMESLASNANFLGGQLPAAGRPKSASPAAGLLRPSAGGCSLTSVFLRSPHVHLGHAVTALLVSR